METIKKIIQFIRDIFENFKPNDFKGDGYLYGLNQAGHFAFSVFLVFVFNLNPILVCLGWFLWESIQVLNSKDYEDFTKDLVFEIGGAILLSIHSVLFQKIYLSVYFILLFVLSVLKENEE